MNYQRAHIAIIKAQFTVKRLRDGMSVRVLSVPPLSPRCCGVRLLVLGVQHSIQHRLVDSASWKLSMISALPS